MVRGAWEDDNSGSRVNSALVSPSGRRTSKGTFFSRAPSKPHSASPYEGNGFVPRGQPGQPRQPKLDKSDGLPLQLRLECKPVKNGVLMGKCRRNPLTGEIIMEKPPDYPNFQVVDLAGRAHLPIDRQELERDPFLFRPMPLEYRTWIYQTHFMNPESLRGPNDLDFVVREALLAFCLDVRMWNSRWSPMMAYAFIMFVVALTCNAWIILSGCCIGMLTCFLSVHLNNPGAYSWDRWVSLPLRVGYLIFILVVFPSETTIEVIGSISTAALVVAELIAGDCQILNTYRFHCSYNIHKSLGHRVYVCTRNGGSTLRQVFDKGRLDRVDERVGGISSWSERYHLIAEMEGLMIELRPMSKEDWRKAAAEYNWHLEPLTYVSVPLAEYDGEVQAKEVEEEDILVPTKLSRPAMRGTTNLNSLQTFRDAREIFDGRDHLDWMIEEVDN